MVHRVPIIGGVLLSVLLFSSILTPETDRSVELNSDLVEHVFKIMLSVAGLVQCLATL